MQALPKILKADSVAGLKERENYMGTDAVEKAHGDLKRITADMKYQEYERIREKIRRDEASAFRRAEQRGKGEAKRISRGPMERRHTY